MPKISFTPPAAISGSCHNDDNSFQQLYIRFWQPLLNQACYYLKDNFLAEEVVQELFIDLYRKKVFIANISHVNSYLRKAVQNRVYNYLLKNKRYRHHLKCLGETGYGNGYNPVENAINAIDRQKEIDFYLSKLSEPCRTVFLLNREQQMTIKEISVQLNRPVDTVTKQLSKAVRYLRQHVYDNRVYQNS